MEGRKVIGWAARDQSGNLSPYSFTLRLLSLSLLLSLQSLVSNCNSVFIFCVNRETGPEDVVFKVLYCGMDHTDLHQIRNEIHSANYPLVPG